MDHSGRVEAVQEELVERSMDAFIVTGPHNCFYLSGFRGTGGSNYPVLLIQQEGDPVLFVSALDEEVAQREAAMPVHAPQDGFAAAIRDRLGDGTSALVTSQMNVGFYHRLGDGISLHIDDTLLSSMRAEKDDDELERIRTAYEIAEDAIGATLPHVVAGQTEQEVAGRVEYEMRQRGSTGTAFPTIVGTGAFTALPHHAATDTTIKEGPLLFDIGSTYEWYHSDISRIYHVGEPSDRFKQVYDVVRAAQDAAADALIPGAGLATVDRAARQIIEESGFGDDFIHSTGHGIGIDVHEAPTLSASADGELRPGMVVTVEPGIYLRGEFGIRIEDAYHITQNGAERLTQSSRDLKVI